MEQKHALGRRKSAVARVYVVSGKGNIVINGRELADYFKGLRDFKQTRIRLVTSTDPDEIRALLDGIADRWGDEPLTEEASVYGV